MDPARGRRRWASRRRLAKGDDGVTRTRGRLAKERRPGRVHPFREGVSEPGGGAGRGRWPFGGVSSARGSAFPVARDTGFKSFRDAGRGRSGFRLRSSLVALVLAVAVVLAGTSFYSMASRRPGEPLADAAAEGADAAGSQGGPATVEHRTLVSFDGTVIAFTVFRPAGASAAEPVPVVFHSHGWGGKRAASPTGIAGRLVEEGFGVVSVDARGHGDSGGYATVQHKDHEVKDYVALVDWVAANLDWVQRDPNGVPGDIVAGGTGYSYAGGFQLQLASRDPRLDAIAPEITWNSVIDSLAPNGAVKGMWVHGLIALAKQGGTRIDPRVEQWYAEAMLTNRLPPDAVAHFEGSAPDLANLTADVLLVQGVPDVLFNLNQAARTYQALEAAGRVDVRLHTHLTGHVVPLQPLGAMPERRATFADEGPCGPLQDLVVAWLHHKLRGGPAPDLPEVSFALDDGECVRLDAYPTGSVDVPLGTLPAPQAAGTLLVPLLEGPALVAGVPRLKATVTAPFGGIAHAGLVLLDAQGQTRVVDDQTAGFRLDAATLDVDLSGVATRLHEGDRLLLRIDGLNEWHATNGGRAPTPALLTDVVVTLPLVDA